MSRPKRTDVATVASAPRPAPPDALFDDSNWFRYLAPADGVNDWVHYTFLREGAPLHNPDHAHLIDADVVYLWAAVENVRQMRRVVGQCEEVIIRAGGWQRARQEQQLCEWFGRVPAFLITFDAHYAREYNDLQWCALVEHELYHIGRRTDEFGAPAFTKDGMPKLGIRGHDIEEFVGIVRRYGVAGGAGDTAALVAAAKRAPEVGNADIARACGTCILRAA
ncbi:TPA: hypothetical protein RKT01_000553 [Burkholderia vietnamiensis]|nr:hypothetical protein [Burkholderia vietnamiensis]